MERLWAPWRMQYIEQIDDPADEGCIFCGKPEENDDEKNLILHRSSHCFVIMNLFPYNNGHLMVIPYRHLSDYRDLTDEELLDMQQLVRKTVGIIDGLMKPQGYNIGMNLGRVAGAGIADHLHTHIVPRWNGDTNFMPVLGQVKVISEELRTTWRKLRAEFERVG